LRWAIARARVGAISDIARAAGGVFSGEASWRKKMILKICAIGSAVAIVIGGSAFAQGTTADMIRAHCISAAQGGWTDFNPESGHGRARTELYISCMQQHGLAP
jgi:hypothetical protein